MAGSSPNYAGLAELARRTGLNIVAGTGYYIGASHPPELADKSVGQVEDEMLRDVLEGIPGTGVRAGVLGEIGTTEPLSPTERTVLEATGRVQAQTGTAIVMHPDSVHRTYEQIAPALDILERAGAALDRVIISHCDDRLHPNYDSYAKLAARGCTLAFDTFGKQTYYATRRRQYPSDDQRIATIARLVGDGLAGSVTLAHDVCYKTDLTRWGGDGYGHVPRNIVPRLQAGRRLGRGDPADAGREPAPAAAADPLTASTVRLRGGVHRRAGALRRGGACGASPPGRPLHPRGAGRASARRPLSPPVGAQGSRPPGG